MNSLELKVALITGAAQRIGAAIARFLHQQGMNVIIHYHASEREAIKLQEELNGLRVNSCVILQADLKQIPKLTDLVTKANGVWQRLDVLINNASGFFPTPVGEVTEARWNDLMDSNVKGAFFLSQAALPFLRKSKGTIINITDIHAKKPLRNYSVYCIAKAALTMLTKSLAKEFAPDVRVNAVAPGAILWPMGENKISEVMKKDIIENSLLKRHGHPDDIAKAVWYLIHDAYYVTGQTMVVDGGRSIK